MKMMNRWTDKLNNKIKNKRHQLKDMKTKLNEEISKIIDYHFII